MPAASTTPHEGALIDPLAVAARLLGDSGVRSVTIDPRNDRATVRYRDARLDTAPLGRLAERLRRDQRALAASAPPLPPDAVEVWTDPDTGLASYALAPAEARGLRRWLHLTLAGVWFLLAVAGAVLPGLPCTCFLLLTSYSLCRGSKRLHRRLLDSRWFGPTLHRWRLHRGVRPGVKTKALATMALTIGTSLCLAPLPAVAWWVVAAAGAIGAGCVARLRVVAF